MFQEQSPTGRGRHCDYYYATETPYDVQDTSGNSFPKGTALKGSYCRSQPSSQKLWKYHGTNKETCQLAMGSEYNFACLTFLKTYSDGRPDENKTGFRCISPNVDLNDLAKSEGTDEGPLYPAMVTETGECVSL